MLQALRFTPLSRILHWTMAVLVLAILFFGIGMVPSLSDYHWLVSIRRPLGILILILVAIRLVNRLLNPDPPLLEWQRLTDRTVVLMFALPIVGWGMPRDLAA